MVLRREYRAVIFFVMLLSGVFQAHGLGVVSRAHFEDVGGTVMPFSGRAFDSDPDKAAECMRLVKDVGGISRFAMAGVGSAVRVRGIASVDAYTRLGKHFEAVRQRVAPEGIQIGYFMSPTHNCGIRHPWTKYTNFDGTVRAFTACIGEEGFRRDLAAKAAALAAEVHPFIHLMEDDFRYWGLGCFCENHLRRFAELTGVKRDREELVKALRVPGLAGQKTRTAWHRMLVGDLVATAKAVADAVAAVSPETRVGLCAPGGFPERDTAEIARALAGKHRPFVRWYGSFYDYDFPVLTSGRLFTVQWAKENLPADIECIYEADPCPHSRFYASAARMEALISTAMAMGYSAPLFHALKPVPDAMKKSPDYLLMHARCKDRFAALKAESASGRIVGVQAVFDSDMRISGMGSDAKRPYDPVAWYRSLNCHGIPVTTADASVKLYSGHHIFNTMDDATITNLLSGNVFLDGAAAEALTERGFADLIGVKATMRDKIDFNVEVRAKRLGGKITYPSSFHQNYGLDGCAVSRLELNGADNMTEFLGAGKRQPSITWFKNARGGKVVVMAVNLAGCKSTNFFSLSKRELLVKLLRMLGGDKAVPVRVLDLANVKLLANDDGKRLFLHLMSLSCDKAKEVSFEVLPPYAGGTVEVLDGATWKKADAQWDGTTLRVRPPKTIKVYGTLDIRIGK